MRPIIGITCGTSDLNTNDSYISNEYISAIESAGGTPIVLPLAKNESSFDGYISIIDGLLLSGGVDMDPSYFGEEPIQALGRIDVERDRIEIHLATQALKLNIPIFGICRGIQTLNVAGGGTLYQDIYSDLNNLLKHRQTAPGSHATHSIKIKEGSKLATIIGQTEFRVNTFHHQSVKDLATGFAISATASDGIIECIESTKHPFAIGVQFHPERMWQNSEPMLALFKAFVDAGISYKEQRIN
ncbi:TPA: gamma-glutamyl-gamma-aminobutyrate hydrolase family protein [bacterium]|nr:gamma-glutamyl-gamma-aminobutyrate hydrolase family protein [bacterium]